MADQNRADHVKRVAARRVARLLDRPLATAVRTAAGATVLLAVLAVVTTPGGLDGVTRVESLGDVVALFGGPTGFVVAVVLAVVVAFLGSLWNAVVTDLRRERQ